MSAGASQLQSHHSVECFSLLEMPPIRAGVVGRSPGGKMSGLLGEINKKKGSGE